MGGIIGRVNKVKKLLISVIRAWGRHNIQAHFIMSGL